MSIFILSTMKLLHRPSNCSLRVFKWKYKINIVFVKTRFVTTYSNYSQWIRLYVNWSMTSKVHFIEAHLKIMPDLRKIDIALFVDCTPSCPKIDQVGFLDTLTWFWHQATIKWPVYSVQLAQINHHIIWFFLLQSFIFCVYLQQYSVIIQRIKLGFWGSLNIFSENLTTELIASSHQKHKSHYDCRAGAPNIQGIQWGSKKSFSQRQAPFYR